MAKVIRKPGAGREKLTNFLNGLAQPKQGRVGWFESAKYEDGTPVASVAYYQEFDIVGGQRSFMRTTAKEQRPAWRDLAGSGARAMMAGNATLGTVMEGLGQQAAGDIAKKIRSITEPPLKQATIDARRRKMASNKKVVGGLTKPLIETGTMFNTLTNDVVGG